MTIIVPRSHPIYHNIFNALWDELFTRPENRVSWLALDQHEGDSELECFYNSRLIEYAGRYCEGKLQFEFTNESDIVMFLLANQV